MRKVCERIALFAVLVGVLGTLPAQRAAAETVGSVISTSGQAYAEGPAGRRPLECGTPIEAGERVVTPEGALVGLLAGDVYVQLDGGTNLGIDRGADGTPSFDLTSGRARILDTREGGAPLVVKTPGATASGAGTDTEIAIGDTGTEFCEDSGNLELQPSTGSSLIAGAGQCVTLAADGSATASQKTAEAIKLAGADACFDVAIVDHFTPGVAAPSAATISLAPIDPDRRIFGPCDDPGSGCTRFIPPPPGGEIMEQPPGPVCAPGFPGFPECGGN